MKIPVGILSPRQTFQKKDVPQPVVRNPLCRMLVTLESKQTILSHDSETPPGSGRLWVGAWGVTSHDSKRQQGAVYAKVGYIFKGLKTKLASWITWPTTHGKQFSHEDSPAKHQPREELELRFGVGRPNLGRYKLGWEPWN
jgi:hypothetical protein